MQDDKPEDSAPKTAEPELVFYYSRQRRLEKASEPVRRLNDPAPQKRMGIFRTLVATRGRAMLFISIVVISGAILFISVLDLFTDSEFTLQGNSITLLALRYEESTFIVLKKTARKEDAYTGAVDLGISAPLTGEEEKRGLQAPVEVARIIFTPEQQEDFRLSVPFNTAEILIILRAGEDRISRRIKSE